MTSSAPAQISSFALPGHLHFMESHPGLPVAHITTTQATAQVALQGAQLLAWQPTGQQPVIWVSKAAVFEPGKPVRGGVPVCWPWFGALAGQSAHGFVRTRMWQVRGSALNAAGQVVLRLGLSDDASTRAVWDHAFDLELVVTVGPTLTLDLITRNTGETPLTLSEALHTYFCVGDINATRVQGLDGCSYSDKVQAGMQCLQQGDVVFSGETDRVYFNTTSDSLIKDTAWQREIRVSKQGSDATVVWNPWAEREKSFADMASGEFNDMLCVETANAGPHQITLAPGAQHTLSACLSVC